VQHRCIRTTDHAISQVKGLGVCRRIQGTEIRARLGSREGHDEVNTHPFGLLSPTILLPSPSLSPVRNGRNIATVKGHICQKTCERPRSHAMPHLTHYFF